MAVTKEELDKIAHEYHEKDLMKDKFIEDECQFYTYDWVFEKMEGCITILEMGYGEGNFTEELVKRNFKPTILDGSDLLLDKAKKLFADKVETESSLFEEFKPTKKFDCILATHVLEHVDNPIVLLKEMKNWLTDDGKLIIIVPNIESLHRQLAVIMGIQSELDTLGERDKLVGHQRVYSIQTLSNDIIESDLKVAETAGFFLKTLPNSMMLGYTKELVIALNKISPLLPKTLMANIGLVATK
jgi:2-polyprenyl-3-methyl-5-hydroxy-6-metoxy-1,4-benzoquinol methylase